jgi:hypothetical protein
MFYINEDNAMPDSGNLAVVKYGCDGVMERHPILPYANPDFVAGAISTE